jgi:hypothetical protein
MSTHVLINGNVCLYQDKAPFIRSGRSVLGAIEYDPATDQLKCHECGESHLMLGRHVAIRHKTTSRDYKLKHGLNQSTALVGESVRVRLSEHAQNRVKRGTLPKIWYDPKKLAAARKLGAIRRRRVHHLAAAERRNAQKHCKAQLMQKLKDIAVILKRTPSRKELKEYGIPSGSLEYHYGSLAKAMELAGLIPNGNIGARNYRLYSDEYLLKSIRIFYWNNQRLPRASDYSRGLMAASRTTYRHRFGALKEAHRQALASMKQSKRKRPASWLERGPY